MVLPIQAFITNKKIAVVGASRTGKKFGNVAGKELRERGYEVFYVHPEAEEINGQITYPNLDAVKDLAGAVWVSVSTDCVADVLRDAAEAGLTHVWLQQGGASPELIAMGKQLGLDLVYGKCILMYAKPVRSYHKIHQVVWKFIGQY